MAVTRLISAQGPAAFRVCRFLPAVLRMDIRLADSGLLRLHRGEAEGVSLFGRAVATVPLAG